MRGSHELAALLRREREALLTRWRRQAMAVPSARGLDAPALTDHVPLVVDALVAALEREEGGDKPPAGAPHGPARLRAGYDIEEVVAELSLLRAAVVELAEAHGQVLQGRGLRLVNETIDQAIADAVRAFADLTIAASERDQEEHLAYVAHDLRSPLGAIGLAVEALSRALPPEADAQATAPRMIRTLRRNVARLASLVENVLEVNVGGAGEAPQLQRTRVQLRRLIDGLVLGMEAAAGDSGTRVIVDIDPALAVRGDARLLERAFQNLLANAIEHASPGTLRLRAAREGGLIRCRVQDTGGGIPSERVARLFERNDDASEGGGHRGLGLVIARQFIEQHGGRIALEQLAQGGAAFLVELPADPPPG